MDFRKASLITAYRDKILKANKELTKKEAFKDLLNRLYHGDAAIEGIIDAITPGVEKAIINIPRKDKLHRGSADTLYNKVIIEYENDLKISGKHAREPLTDYLLGAFRFYAEYSENNDVHQQLAGLSEQAHRKAKDYVEAHPPPQELSTIFLGRLRVELKKYLREEMEGINELVGTAIG